MASGAVRAEGQAGVGPPAVRTARPATTVVLAWLAMLGLDVFLHAGLLAPLYDWTSPFLLRPEEAFIRIPIGYLGFLVLVVGLAWLLARLDVRGGRQGGLIGAALGAVVWGALLLGLWSISTAQPGLLVGWWLGQVVELGLGGAVIGAMLGGASTRSIAWRVGGVILAGAASAIVLQAIGYAEVPVVIR